jgi:ABC-type lipoprotein release transport system permease subunit
VAWQASTLAVAGSVIGVPLGIVAGRAVWKLVADDLGVAATFSLSVVAVLIVVSGTVLLANLTAFLPARSAARTRPALVLRSE